MTARPLTRSHERVFILCGIADEPTWPGWKPSVTSSMPGHQPDRGGEAATAPAAAWTSAETTSKSSERG